MICKGSAGGAKHDFQRVRRGYGARFARGPQGARSTICKGSAGGAEHDLRGSAGAAEHDLQGVRRERGARFAR
eukprot:694088-Prorocentrum_minimum.AAC.1